VTDDEIDDLVERWHQGAGGRQELHEFLGMTWDEYAEFTRAGTVPDWLRSLHRKQNRPGPLGHRAESPGEVSNAVDPGGWK
jgi:hypothetical protein